MGVLLVGAGQDGYSSPTNTFVGADNTDYNGGNGASSWLGTLTDKVVNSNFSIALQCGDHTNKQTSYTVSGTSETVICSNTSITNTTYSKKIKEVTGNDTGKGSSDNNASATSGWTMDKSVDFYNTGIMVGGYGGGGGYGGVNDRFVNKSGGWTGGGWNGWFGQGATDGTGGKNGSTAPTSSSQWSPYSNENYYNKNGANGGGGGGAAQPRNGGIDPDVVTESTPGGKGGDGVLLVYIEFLSTT